MVEITVNYQGELHCQAQHGPSQMFLETDAPVDNQGRGEAFSPTDLVATALGTCMATMMGIVARQKDLTLQGLRIVVKKVMSSDLPRRISQLEVEISVPLPSGHASAESLETAAMNCPVNQSLHPDVDVKVRWKWA